MARATGTTNDKAFAAFIETRNEIDRLLAELVVLSADHFHARPDEITWGHVGTAKHIRDRLKEIANFATGKG